MKVAFNKIFDNIDKMAKSYLCYKTVKTDYNFCHGNKRRKPRSKSKEIAI